MQPHAGPQRHPNLPEQQGEASCWLLGTAGGSNSAVCQVVSWTGLAPPPAASLNQPAVSLPCLFLDLPVQYRTQFSVSAAGKLRLMVGDARANTQLMLKATGSARLTFGGTTITITGGCIAPAVRRRACLSQQRCPCRA